jgi:hypothetical protein
MQPIIRGGEIGGVPERRLGDALSIISERRFWDAIAAPSSC